MALRDAFVNIAQGAATSIANRTISSAVQGVAAEDPSSKVFRILSNKDVAEVEKQIG